MEHKLTKDAQKALTEALANYLDTRDKRFMFFKCTFPRLVSRINLEGSAYAVSWNIYFEFEKQQMLGSLMAEMNRVFETNLILDIKHGL